MLDFPVQLAVLRRGNVILWRFSKAFWSNRPALRQDKRVGCPTNWITANKNDEKLSTFVRRLLGRSSALCFRMWDSADVPGTPDTLNIRLGEKGPIHHCSSTHIDSILQWRKPADPTNTRFIRVMPINNHSICVLSTHSNDEWLWQIGPLYHVKFGKHRHMELFWFFRPLFPLDAQHEGENRTQLINIMYLYSPPNWGMPNKKWLDICYHICDSLNIDYWAMAYLIMRHAFCRNLIFFIDSPSKIGLPW